MIASQISDLVREHRCLRIKRIIQIHFDHVTTWGPVRASLGSHLSAAGQASHSVSRQLLECAQPARLCAGVLASLLGNQRKRYEDAPHSQSTQCEIYLPDVLINGNAIQSAVNGVQRTARPTLSACVQCSLVGRVTPCAPASNCRVEFGKKSPWKT